MTKKKVALSLFASVTALAGIVALALPQGATDNSNQQASSSKFVYHGACNPYLPVWEHIPYVE
ncbi:MAG: hypothetical protein K2G34_10745, partial [Bacteroides sp.]|nr:hypothetical protein [Bacteroides sp.]